MLERSNRCTMQRTSAPVDSGIANSAVSDVIGM